MTHVLPAILTLIIAPSAIACSFTQRTDNELFEKSKNIFRARVVEVRLATLTNPANSREKIEVVEAKYEIKEVFKGTPPASGIVRDMPFAPGNCSLGLLPGMEYVFFPGEQDMVLLPSGSFAYFNSEGTAVKPRLESLRKLTPPVRQ